MKEMLIQSLVQEDPLEKEMATHSRILAWKIPWTEDCLENPMDRGTWRATAHAWGCKKSDTT